MTKTINLYINGTDELSKGNSLAAILHRMTEQDETQESMCLDGCGVNNSDFRDLKHGIFTFNLEKQVDDIVEKIRQEINTGEKLRLNLYGFSRGGAAVFWICQKLKDVDPSTLKINFCSFEPVTGNAITSTRIEKILGTKSTLSSIIADLSHCINIRKGSILFTNTPMPDFICHGPILPVFPAQAQVLVDVIPGTHKSAEIFWGSGSNLEPFNNESAIAFHMVTRFLESCGTRFNETRQMLGGKLEANTNLVPLFEETKEKMIKSTRTMHFSTEIQTTPGKTYLNLTHKFLSNGLYDEDTSSCVLSVRKQQPKISPWK